MRAMQMAKPQRQSSGGSANTAPTVTTLSSGPYAPSETIAGGSTQIPKYGTATLRVYPINEDQLSELGLLRGISAASMTAAGTLFGFGINVFKDLQISTGTPVAAAVRWQTIAGASVVVGIICAIVAVIFWRKGSTKLTAIKNRTSFG